MLNIEEMIKYLKPEDFELAGKMDTSWGVAYLVDTLNARKADEVLTKAFEADEELAFAYSGK